MEFLSHHAAIPRALAITSGIPQGALGLEHGTLLPTYAVQLTCWNGSTGQAGAARSAAGTGDS